MNPAGNVSVDQLTMSCGQNKIFDFCEYCLGYLWSWVFHWFEWLNICDRCAILQYWLIISRCSFMLVHTYVHLCFESVNTMLAPHHEVLKHDIIPCHMTLYFCANQERRAFRQQFMAPGWRSWELRGCNSIKLTVFYNFNTFLWTASGILASLALQ